MVRRSPRHALLLATALLAAACTNDGSGSSGEDPAEIELTAAEQELADAFAADFADEDDGFGVSAAEGECLATVLMGEIGAEPFEEAGVTPEDLGGDETPGELLGEGTVSEDQADAIYTGWEDCTDLVAAFADSFQREYEADEATRECFRTGLEEGDLLRQYMIASFTRDAELDAMEPPLSDIITLVGECTATDTGGSADALVGSIADSLAAGGTLTPEEAQCVAQSIVDTVGADELLQSVAGGDISTASPEAQQAIVEAITGAAAACDVPLTKLNTG